MYDKTYIYVKTDIKSVKRLHVRSTMPRSIVRATPFQEPIEGDRAQFEEVFLKRAMDYADHEVEKLEALEGRLIPSTRHKELLMIENDCYLSFLRRRFGDEWKVKGETEYPLIFQQHLYLEHWINRI